MPVNPEESGRPGADRIEANLPVRAAGHFHRFVLRAGGSAPLGARGEDIPELMLRRACPNATIAKQVMYKIDRNTKTFCDFVVGNEGKVVAIWESKVNRGQCLLGRQHYTLKARRNLFR